MSSRPADPSVRLGLYRTLDPILGECACVDKRAGDAAPFLLRVVYDTLHFTPDYDELPLKTPHRSIVDMGFGHRLVGTDLGGEDLLAAGRKAFPHLA